MNLENDLRIKTFFHNHPGNLEAAVNEWLSKNPVNVLDTKYTAVYGHSRCHENELVTEYMAVILFKKSKLT